MTPSLQAVREAAARQRKAEAEAKKKGGASARKAEAGAEAKEAKIKKKTEAREERTKAKSAKGNSEAEVTKKKKAVAKEAKKVEMGRPKKRPRSSSPTPPSSSRRPRMTPKAPVDAIVDVPSEPEVEALMPLPSPLPKTGPSISAAEPASDTILPTAELEVEEPQVDPELSAEGASTPAEVREEGESSPFSLRSALDRNGKWAEQAMAQLCPSEMTEGLLHRKSSSFFRDAFTAHLWAANSLVAMREVLSRAKSTVGQSSDEADEARARAASAGKALEDAISSRNDERTRADNAEQALAEERAKADKAGQALTEERARAERAERALEDARRRAEDAEAERQTQAEKAEALQQDKVKAEEKLQQKESELLSCQLELHHITILKKDFEQRVDSAEEIARNADALVADMKEAVKVAEEKAKEAEQNAANAIAVFRQSADYERELADSTAFCYNMGFKECKEKVIRLYNLPEVDSLEPEDPADAGDQPPLSPSTQSEPAPAQP